jgi:predicted small integral membrane protein
MRRIALALLATPAQAQQAGWGNTGQPVDKGFSWTDPLWPSFWMAWTPATLAFFVALFAAMGLLTLLEIRRPGGDERRGILGLTTTRGDRLFISLLGSAYILLIWLALVGSPLWGALAVCVVFALCVFRWV